MFEPLKWTRMLDGMWLLGAVRGGYARVFGWPGSFASMRSPAEAPEPRNSNRQALQRLNPLRHDPDEPVEDDASEQVPPPRMIVVAEQGKPAEDRGRSSAEGTASACGAAEVSAKPPGRSRLLVLPGHVPPLKRPRPTQRTTCGSGWSSRLSFGLCAADCWCPHMASWWSTRVLLVVGVATKSKWNCGAVAGPQPAAVGSLQLRCAMRDLRSCRSCCDGVELSQPAATAVREVQDSDRSHRSFGCRGYNCRFAVKTAHYFSKVTQLPVHGKKFVPAASSGTSRCKLRVLPRQLLGRCNWSALRSCGLVESNHLDRGMASRALVVHSSDLAMNAGDDVHDEFSWADVSVVTLRDRSGRSEATCTAEESSNCSTSESDIDEEFFDLQEDERETNVTDGLDPLDFFPTEKADETEIALPSVEEAKAQIENIRARRRHISEIAQRYSGSQSHQARHDSRVCQKEQAAEQLPQVLPRVLQSALQGIDADSTKLKAGLAREETQREELWMKFLCGNDAPVGGDALPSPDEFFGTKGDDDSFLHELVLAPACAPLLPSTQTNVTSEKFVKCSSPCLVEGILRHVAQPRHAAAGLIIHSSRIERR
eukprot:s1435_g3.t1